MIARRSPPRCSSSERADLSSNRALKCKTDRPATSVWLTPAGCCLSMARSTASHGLPLCMTVRMRGDVRLIVLEVACPPPPPPPPGEDEDDAKGETRQLAPASTRNRAMLACRPLMAWYSADVPSTVASASISAPPLSRTLATCWRSYWAARCNGVTPRD